MTYSEASKRTAITRPKNTAAKPLRELVNLVDITGHVLHHGSGKDQAGTELLRKQPHVIQVTEYDPNFTDELDITIQFDTIVSIYVACVLPPVERAQMMLNIMRRLRHDGVLYMASRGAGDRSCRGTPYMDGRTTSIGTFQTVHNAQSLEFELSSYFPHTETLYGAARSSNFVIVKATF